MDLSNNVNTNQDDDKDMEPVIRSGKKEAFTGATFSDMNQQLQGGFSKTRVPKWRYIDKGMNLRGKCINQKCEAKNQIVFIQLKFGQFSINELVCDSPCVMCKETLEEVENVYFFMCQWSAEGMIQGEKTKKKFSGVSNDPEKYTYFQEGKNVIWKFLKINVEPLKMIEVEQK